MRQTIFVYTVTLLLTATALSKEAVNPTPGATTIVSATEASCSAFATADLSGILDAPTQLMSATSVKAGEDLPAYCQVKGYITPNVGILMALPMAWNGKFMQEGCGGHCGVLDEDFTYSCRGPLRKGYACIISDAGHKGTGGDGLWAYHNLQAKVDWGYRAMHVTALAGKAIAERFYNQKPSRSYFAGCSTGGRQGLMEAQRFPSDFDGIIAGGAPVDLATLYMSYVWGIRATHDASGQPLLADRELKLVTDAAVAKCDKDDGVKDGIISDPLRCRFDPAELACSTSHPSECLTAAQVDAVRKVYEGPVTSTGRKLSLGGPAPGSESGTWQLTYVGRNGQPSGTASIISSGFKYLFFWPEPGPAWEFKDFDFDRDYQRMGMMGALSDANNPDLRQFKAAGGKLLIHVGTNDLGMLLRSDIDYYETVERTMGGRQATQDFARLFVLPGVEHCGGGVGAGAVDYLSYLEAWVEKGQAPDQMLAAHLKDGHSSYQPQFPLDPNAIAFTRPVYPYPIRAKYRGRGDPNDAANFGPAGP